MRVFLIALGLCVSSAVVSAGFFLTVFQNDTSYEANHEAKKPDTVVEAESAIVETPPTINMAALASKGLSADELARKRARKAYRVPIPRQNPFDQIVDISELIAVSGEDLEDQTAAIGLSPSLELAKEQLDELSDDRALAAAAAIAPEVLDDVTVDPGNLGILGVIIDTALNGGQTINTNRDVGPEVPTVDVIVNP